MDNACGNYGLQCEVPRRMRLGLAVGLIGVLATAAWAGIGIVLLQLI